MQQVEDDEDRVLGSRASAQRLKVAVPIVAENDGFAVNSKASIRDLSGC